MQTYTWRDGSRINADPQVVGETLTAIAAQQGREFDGLTAADVVEAAAEAGSPLHELFEWDDATAATIHRQDQARSILRSLRVQVISSGEPRAVVGYVNVQPAENAAPVYILTSTAMRHEALRRQILADARSGLNGWMRRYQDLAGIGEVLGIVETAVEQLDCLIEATEDAAVAA